MTPWLHVIGLGEDGPNGLRPAARAALEAAEVVVGGARHHALTPGLAAERLEWPSPFDAMLDRLASLRGRRVAALVTGDPTWRSAGSRLAAAFGAEAAVHPQISAYQLAAARMGWALEDCETLTAHGRPVAGLIPFLQPGARWIVLTGGPGAPSDVAAMLTARGWGSSRLTVLAHMDGAAETRTEARAEDWRGAAPAFHALAVACVAGPEARLAPASPGLPDDLFAHDGTMTKRDVRAATLARLAPTPGALLWDVGCGCGSVAVEWMRAARGARAVGIEPRADRRALAAANAEALGAPGLQLREGRAPEALAGLAPPDAVFLGGGASEAAADAALAALRPRGRLVANAVTLESEAVLSRLFARHGGELVRLQVSRAEPVGGLTGWRPSMPVTQWSLAT